MSQTYEAWLADVHDRLRNVLAMNFDKWQAAYPYDFQADYAAGIAPREAADRANDFWWKEQDKVFNPRDFHRRTKI